jgi:hypothetical protein
VDEERFKCKECDRIFIYASRLKLHIDATHNQLRQFKCRVSGCSRDFKFSSNRGRHEVSEHGVNIKDSCGKLPKALIGDAPFKTRIQKIAKK